MVTTADKHQYFLRIAKYAARKKPIEVEQDVSFSSLSGLWQAPIARSLNVIGV